MFCDTANLLEVKQPRREAHLHPMLQVMNTGNYTSNPPIRLQFMFLYSALKNRQILTVRYSELADCINQDGRAYSTHFRAETMKTKFYESEKIKERDNLGYIVLDGTLVVSPLQCSVPVQMATDVSKDHAASIFTPTAPKTGQRWRSELL
jgi:hypothetical protein